MSVDDPEEWAWTTERAQSRLAPVVADRDEDAADTLAIPAVRRSGRWQTRWPFLLIAVWAAIAAVDVLVLGVGSRGPAASKPASAATATPSVPAMSAAPSSLPSAQPTLAVQVLAPASASAYGPTGAGSGDNSSRAYEAIDASPTTAWESDWYTTASFGSLQGGTGLLIDMGQPVTITSVQLLLGTTPGADLQLLTGPIPDLSLMQLQASATDAGGQLTLALTRPERARYLMIWFTMLPPDSTGTYQAAVYNVSIEGMP